MRLGDTESGNNPDTKLSGPVGLFQPVSAVFGFEATGSGKVHKLRNTNVILTVVFAALLSSGVVQAGPFAEHGVTPDEAVAWASFVVEAQGQSPASNILGPVDANWAIGHPAGGSITVGFDYPIYNGAGPDFAVWENAFSVTGGGNTIFAELGYVDVSTDGENWVTFPSVYLDDPNDYTNIEPNNVYNLAGNYIGHYVPIDQREGTPFDLDDLLNTAEVAADLVNPNIINFVRIRDIISPPVGGNNYDQATYFSCEQCSENHRISDGNANTELGGGGGADAFAEAGGRDASKLPDAIELLREKLGAV